MHKRRYQWEHPDEFINDNNHPLPWRRGLCNAKDKFGNTPLHYAAIVGNADVAKQLLELLDVDPRVCSNNGGSPLRFALEHRDCALAIAAKLSKLGVKAQDDGNYPEGPLSKSRTAAEMFVRALKEEYRYGVYPTE